jgi:hypothetical protein
MHFRRLGVSALLVLGLLLGNSAFTQDLPKAEKYKDGQWFVIQFVKFKPGKEFAANKFIEKHFVPVDVELGRNIVGYEYVFGAWDQLVFFPMESPSDISWKMTPGGEKWFAAFSKHAGGMENAVKLMDEFSAMVAEQESAMVRLIK